MLSSFINRFRRITSTALFIPEIDGLRFVAIALVVFHHIQGFVIEKNPFGFTHQPTDYSILFTFFNNGNRGVELFFVISGFILALPFAKRYLFRTGDTVNIKKYFLRRLTRLEPPYILTMVACFILLILKGTYSASELWRSLLTSLLYLHNLLPFGPSVNGVAWSLEIEVQFYIVAPLLALIFRLSDNYRRPTLLFIIIANIVMTTVLPLPVRTLYSYLHYFMLGFLLVDIYLKPLALNPSRVLSSILGILFFFTLMYINTNTLAGEILFLLSIFGFYFLALHTQFWQNIFRLPILTFIGGMCYSIYLWHDIVMSFIGNKTILIHSSQSYPLMFFFNAAIIIPCILIVCSIFYLLVERPCMDRQWPYKIKRRLQQLFNQKEIGSE